MFEIPTQITEVYYFNTYPFLKGNAGRCDQYDGQRIKNPLKYFSSNASLVKYKSDKIFSLRKKNILKVLAI